MIFFCHVFVFALPYFLWFFRVCFINLNETIAGVGNTSHYGNLPVRSFLYSPEHQNDRLMLNNSGNNGVLGPDFGADLGHPSPQLQSSLSHLYNHHQSSSPSHHNMMGGMQPSAGMSNNGNNDGGMEGLPPAPLSNNSSAYLPMNPNNKHFHHQASSNSLLNDEQEASSPSNSNQHLIPISAGASSPG